MKTIDISGMGGGYENCCQVMLFRGISFLSANPNFNWEGSYKGSPQIYGVLISENEDAKTLDDVITKDTGSTGAMHQAVIGHLKYIADNGYQKWISYFEDNPELQDRVYEIDPGDLEDNLKNDIAIFQAKIEKGYDPIQDLRDLIPEDQWISVNPDDEDSIKKACGEIVRRINGLPNNATMQ